MTEEKKTYDKPLNYETMIYVGREFVRKFDNEDGTVTKSYKYKFKKHESSQFATNFWAYETTKGADKLEEGEVFDVGFVLKDNPKGDKPMRMAKFFGKPKEQQPSEKFTPGVEVNEWVKKIEANKDGFLKMFGNEGGEELFIKWSQLPEKCETDIFVGKDRQYLMDVYMMVLAHLNDVI